MSKLSLKDLLFICFCAVLLIAVRAAFRWRLGISGHAMFFTVFFLLLSRSCVSHRFTATLTGFFAGTAAIALGMGKGGPLTLLNFLFPALAIDLGAFLFPPLLGSYPLCALVGAFAGASKFFSAAAIGLLIGMDRTVLWQRAFIEAGAAMAFGCLGALCLPPVVKRLRAYGLFNPSGE